MTFREVGQIRRIGRMGGYPIADCRLPIAKGQGEEDLLAHLPGCGEFCAFTGGIADSTPGYSLATLRVGGLGDGAEGFFASPIANRRYGRGSRTPGNAMNWKWFGRF